MLNIFLWCFSSSRKTKKYHIVGTIPKPNIKIVKRGNSQIHDAYSSGLVVTSITIGGVKRVLWTKLSLLVKWCGHNYLFYLINSPTQNDWCFKDDTIHIALKWIHAEMTLVFCPYLVFIWNVFRYLFYYFCSVYLRIRFYMSIWSLNMLL